MASSTGRGSIQVFKINRSIFIRPTLIVLVFLLVFTFIYPVFANETAVPVMESQASNLDQNGPNNFESSPQKPSTEFFQKKEDPTPKEDSIKPEKEEYTNPLDKQPQEQTTQDSFSSLSSATETSTQAPKFDIPAESKATVDESSGALSYSYPFEFPEGRAGLTPELSLNYNSRNSSKPDSFVGLGWELSIPYILREPLYGTQNLYTKNTFSSSLSGNLVATTDNSINPYTTYRSEIDNGEYFKYKLNSDNSWTVNGKDGLTYVFGMNAGSRQDHPSDSTKIYKWVLTSITDPHGNSIQYSYFKDAGQIYPDVIMYANHPSSPAVHQIKFTYVNPPDFGATVYNSGFPVTTYKILERIVAETNIGDAQGRTTYLIGQSGTQYIRQHRLISINVIKEYPNVEYYEPGDNRTEFTYSIKEPGWQQGTHNLNEYLTSNHSENMSNVHNADFDMNGYSDIFLHNGSSTTPANSLLLNNGSNFVDSAVAWSLPAHNMPLYQVIVDLNGDKLPDFAPRWLAEHQELYLNTGTGFVRDDSGLWKVQNYIPAAQCGPNNGDRNSTRSSLYLYDMNFDGKNDLVYFGGSSDFQVWLNNGNGWTQSTAYSFTSKPGANYTIAQGCGLDTKVDYQKMIDFNGDGLLDWYHKDHGIHLNSKNGFIYNPDFNVDIDDLDRFTFGDINNDGLIDYIGNKTYSGSRCIRVAMNTGKGFVEVNPNQTSGCTMTTLWDPSDLRYHNNDPRSFGVIMDVTADGFIDVVGADVNLVNGKVRQISGGVNKWVVNTNVAWSPIVNPANGVFFDINTDGVLDFVTPSTTKFTSETSRVFMGKPNVPNLLSSIRTPLGAETVIDYKTAPTNLNDTDVSPISVVDRITIQNIGLNQPSMVSRYDYSNGVYVLDPVTGQKKFSGFNKITTTESGIDLTPIRITDTYFHQGNGSHVASNEPVDTSHLIGKEYYSILKNQSGTIKKETWKKYGSSTIATEPNSARVAKFIHPSSLVTKTTDSILISGTAETYVYSAITGEKTEHRTLGFVNVSSTGTYTDISGDSRFEYTTYAQNTNGSIVKPVRKELRTSTSTRAAISRTEYFYDNQTYGLINGKGDLTKETSWLAGNGTTSATSLYTYDSFGNVLTGTNPRGAVTSYTYDFTNQVVVTEKNHFNQITTHEYSVLRLVNSTDANGRKVIYTYSSWGSLFRTYKQTPGVNQITSVALERVSSYWEVLTLSSPSTTAQHRETVVIDNLGRPVRSIKGLLNDETAEFKGHYLKEAKSYDALGRLISTSAPYGVPEIASSYAPLVNLIVPSNLVTSTTYDVLDRPINVTDVHGVTTYVYAGAETTTTNPKGQKKGVKVNAYGDIAQVKEYNGSSIYTTNYSYNSRSELTRITDALGNIRNFVYNNAGWLTSSEDLHAPTDITFGIHQYTYDLNGNVLTHILPNGTIETKTYDLLDRVLTIDGSSTSATDYSYTYDTCTNGKGSVCTISGQLPSGNTLLKSFQYNISGVPTSYSLITLGKTYVTTYGYNQSDEVKEVTYPDGTKYRIVYGDWAKPGKIYLTLPGKTEVLYASISYHHTEQPLQTIVTNGVTTTNTYDENKLYRKTNSTTSFSGSPLQSFGYTYDAIGNISKVIENGITKDYTYDGLNRLTQAIYTPTTGTKSTYSYAYNQIGNITSANGKTYSYSSENKTNPHAVTNVSSSTGIQELLSAPWNLIGNNSAAELYQTVPANILNGKTSITVTYDLNGLCAIGGDASAIIFDQNGWKYVSLADYGKNCFDGDQTVTIPLSAFAGLNTADSLTGSLHTRFWSSTAFNVVVKSIKINAVGAESLNYTYDDNGNITNAPNKVFGYNWQNQMQSVVINGTTTVTSEYDESGQRVIYKTPTTTEVQIDDAYIVRNGVPEINISVNGASIGLVKNGAIYSHVADHLGTPMKTLNSAGVVSESVSYGPYGAVLSQTGSLNAKKGYTGHEEDVETGLTYMEARYYDPSLNRFLSQDPAFIRLDRLSQQIADPQGWNSYAYARNNPIRLVDPDGEWFWEAVDAVMVARKASTAMQSLGNYLGDHVTHGIGNTIGSTKMQAVATQNLKTSGPQLIKDSKSLAVDGALAVLPVPLASVKGVNKIASAGGEVSNVSSFAKQTASHAHEKHALRQAEWGTPPPSELELAKKVDNVLKNFDIKTRIRGYQNGHRINKTYYGSQTTREVVIKNNRGNPTIFTNRNPRNYIKRNTINDRKNYGSRR